MTNLTLSAAEKIAKVKFRVYDIKTNEFWTRDYTLYELAESNQFLNNSSKHYKIVQVEKDK